MSGLHINQAKSLCEYFLQLFTSYSCKCISLYYRWVCIYYSYCQFHC